MASSTRKARSTKRSTKRTAAGLEVWKFGGASLAGAAEIRTRAVADHRSSGSTRHRRVSSCRRDGPPARRRSPRARRAWRRRCQGRGRLPAPPSRRRQSAAASRTRPACPARDDRRRGARVSRSLHGYRPARTHGATGQRSARFARRAPLSADPCGGSRARRPACGVRRRARHRDDRRSARRRGSQSRRHRAAGAAADPAAARTRHHRGGPRLHRPRAGRQRDYAGARRHGSDRDDAGPLARRATRRACGRTCPAS